MAILFLRRPKWKADVGPLQDEKWNKAELYGCKGAELWENLSVVQRCSETGKGMWSGRFTIILKNHFVNSDFFPFYSL